MTNVMPLQLIDQPTKSPPAPRGVQFIALREACCRSGVPMETLARRCRGEWSDMNLAALMPPAAGGKACWHVREDVDPRFARAKSPDLLPIDWTKLNDKQRCTVRRRHELLTGWLDARETDFAKGFSEREATAAYVDRVRVDGGGVSRGSLYRWFDGYRAAGLAGLNDKRLLMGHSCPDADPFIEELKRLYLKPRYSKAMCYALACEKAEAKGWAIPFGERQALNVLAAIPNKVVSYHRDGPRAYNAKHGRYIERDYSKLASNQLWVSDGYTMDVVVNVGSKLMRPTLVSWMDVRSRYPVGWRIVPRAENADVILAAFRAGVKIHGAPEIVFHDNGEAYDSTALQGVSKRDRRQGVLPTIDLGLFPRLEIGVKHSLPYNAKAKMNERWHRIVKERFCTRFETYTGGSPNEKPFDLEKNKNAGKSPALEELIEAFQSWLIVDYTMKNHGGADMDAAPAEVFAANLKTKRVIDERLLMLETCRRELLKVGRNGVTWRGLTYQAPELDNMTGDQVYIVIDDNNVNQATMLYAGGARKGAAICDATLARRLDVIASEEDTRDALAEVRRDARRVREAGPARVRLADDPIERLNRIAAKRAGDAPLPSPESLKPVRMNNEPPPLRIAGNDVGEAEAGFGSFGYYSQFADEDDAGTKAVNQ
ncbi:MAG: Mu transposase C-terminal domain-containing protein [Burkholderiales bacterium]|nr:Mu transposase C-terminal domain-containing protein [Phycisphaerae bacterium]